MTIKKDKFMQLAQGLEGGIELAESIFNDLQDGFKSIDQASIDVGLFKDEMIDMIHAKQDMRWIGPLIFVRNVEKKFIEVLN